MQDPAKFPNMDVQRMWAGVPSLATSPRYGNWPGNWYAPHMYQSPGIYNFNPQHTFMTPNIGRYLPYNPYHPMNQSASFTSSPVSDCASPEVKVEIPETPSPPSVDTENHMDSSSEGENVGSGTKVFVTGGGGRVRKRPLESGKPPYSYIALICMSIANMPDRCATLREIITYIETRFPYYRQHKRWHGTIRHNLTLNDCFLKMPRRAGDKGHPWSIDPNFEDMFDSGSLLRRRYRYKEGTAKWIKSRKSAQKAEKELPPNVVIIDGKVVPATRESVAPPVPADREDVVLQEAHQQAPSTVTYESLSSPTPREAMSPTMATPSSRGYKDAAAVGMPLTSTPGDSNHHHNNHVRGCGIKLSSPLSSPVSVPTPGLPPSPVNQDFFAFLHSPAQPHCEAITSPSSGYPTPPIVGVPNYWRPTPEISFYGQSTAAASPTEIVPGF